MEPVIVAFYVGEMYACREPGNHGCPETKFGANGHSGFVFIHIEITIVGHAQMCVYRLLHCKPVVI